MQALNDALLVYMLDAAAPVWGRLKIQKTPFLVELALRKIGRVASTFSFKRYQNGPFSQEVWNSLDRMTKAGFLNSHYGVTDRGLFLVDLIHSMREIDKNSEIFESMSLTLRHCKTHGGTALMHEIYDLEVEPDGMPGERRTIRDIPSGVLILSDNDSDLSIPQDVVDILECEIGMSDSELDDARGRIEEIDRAAIQRLLAASSSSLPS